MPKRGRPPSFSREELITAARRLGPDNIGMQAVAEELGVARTSLYWHVRDQSELGELVLAALVDEAGGGGWAPGAGPPWDQGAEGFRGHLGAPVPPAGLGVRYGTSRSFYSAHSLRSADRLLAALVEA